MGSHNSYNSLSQFRMQLIAMEIIIIIIIILLYGLGRLTCSGIDALPSFARASTISSCSRFVISTLSWWGACVPQRPYGLCRRELYVPGRVSQAGQTVRENPD